MTTTIRKQFFTDTGLSVPAVTEAEMREVDRVAIDDTGPALLQMMENAGRSLALQALELLGHRWQQASVVVLAGTGGNGGGGICAARHLANRQMDVTLCISAPQRLREVPACQHHVYRATAGAEVTVAELPAEPVDLVIDAILGYSLNGAPRGAALDMVTWANRGQAPILSLDVPSGVDSTTGEVAGASIRARTTLTLALPKLGLVSERTGTLVLADIGIPAATYRQLHIPYVDPFGNRYRVPLAYR